MFYALATHGELLKDKISIFIALAPVTKVTNLESKFFSFTSLFYDEIDSTLNLLGIHEILGANWMTQGTTKTLCKTLEKFCIFLEGFYINNDPHTDDTDRFAVYMSHSPNGTPTKSLLHYAQNYREDRFQEWAPDYDKWFNKGEQKQT